MATEWVVAIRYEEPFEAVSRIPLTPGFLTVEGDPVAFADPVGYAVVDADNLSREHGLYDDPQEAQRVASRLRWESGSEQLESIREGE